MPTPISTGFTIVSVPPQPSLVHLARSIVTDDVDSYVPAHQYTAGGSCFNYVAGSRCKPANCMQVPGHTDMRTRGEDQVEYESKPAVTLAR